MTDPDNVLSWRHKTDWPLDDLLTWARFGKTSAESRASLFRDEKNRLATIARFSALIAVLVEAKERENSRSGAGDLRT